jgi:hypothetical protein
MISIKRDIRVLEKHFEGCFPFQGVPRRLGERIRGEEHLRNHRLFEPAKEGFDERLGLFPPMGELSRGFEAVLPDVRFLLIQPPDVLQGARD